MDDAGALTDGQTDGQTGGRTIDEMGNHCFGCGTGNPQGLNLTFVLETAPDGTATATATATMTRLHEGAPGYLHGGIIATLLDEAMSKLNRPLNALAMTRSLSVDYLRPVPLGVPIQIVGTHTKRDGRKLFHTAEIRSTDGKLLARGEGFFLVVDPALLTQNGMRLVLQRLPTSSHIGSP